MLEFDDEDDDGLDMTPVVPSNHLRSARLPSQMQYCDNSSSNSGPPGFDYDRRNGSYRDNGRNNASTHNQNAYYDEPPRHASRQPEQQNRSSYFSEDRPRDPYGDRQRQNNAANFDGRQGRSIDHGQQQRSNNFTADTSAGSYRPPPNGFRNGDNSKNRQTKFQKPNDKKGRDAHDYRGKKQSDKYQKLQFYRYQKVWLDSIMDKDSKDEYEYDPFKDYPDHELRSGVIVTDELPANDYPNHSFFAYCQDNQQFYIVPRLFTTPPKGLRLTIKNRWDRKFELEFGKLIYFKVEENSHEILVFRKGPTDNIPVENVSGHNCFKIQVVFNEDFTQLHTFEFGDDQVTQVIEGIVPDLVYDCYVEFDVASVKQRIKRLKVFKIECVSTEQHIAASAPWSLLQLSKVVADTEEEIIEIPVIANKPGIRYCSNGIINLAMDVNEPIRICHEREKEFEIGSLFKFDYLQHPNAKYFAVTAAYTSIGADELRDEAVLQYREIDEDVFGFLIKLDLCTHNNGFFYHKHLGMIANSNGCLRFLPYSPIRPPNWDPDDDIIKVFVKVVFNQPAKFDIYDLPNETLELVNLCEPKPLIVNHLMLMGNGRCFSKDYPILKLYIHETQQQKYSMGDLLKGKFERNVLDPENDNSYISTEIEKVETQHWKVLKVTDFYGFFSFRANVIKYEAEPSNKTLKKNPAKSAETLSSDYHLRFNGFLECPDGGLISGIKYNPDNCSAMQFIIAEIDQDPHAQTPFKYFSPYHSVKHTLDTATNAALLRRVNRVLNIHLNEEELIDLSPPEEQEEASDPLEDIPQENDEILPPNQILIPAMNEPDPILRETSSSRLSNPKSTHSRTSHVVTADEPRPGSSSRQSSTSTPIQDNDSLRSFTPFAQNLDLFRRNPAIHALRPDIFQRIEDLAHNSPPRPSLDDPIRRTRNEVNLPQIDMIAQAFGVYI